MNNHHTLDSIARRLTSAPISEMHELIWQHGVCLANYVRSWVMIIYDKNTIALLKANGWDLVDYIEECKLYTGDSHLIKDMCAYLSLAR